MAAARITPALPAVPVAAPVFVLRAVAAAVHTALAPVHKITSRAPAAGSAHLAVVPPAAGIAALAPALPPVVIAMAPVVVVAAEAAEAALLRAAVPDQVAADQVARRVAPLIPVMVAVARPVQVSAAEALAACNRTSESYMI